MIFDTLLDITGLREGLKKIKNASSDELKGASTVFEQTGGKLTKFITKPALGAATAITGLSLVKGFNRLKNIDTAKAQLEGLGHSAKEVEAIMDSAMQSVKGTAYGFDEAATAAASAVAAGIEPGKELTRYLSLVGDAAAQSKLSFAEMGSIFNKISASGKISMEEVNQLADQGIPIYKMLSKQLGITQADVRDMVSSGKVDSETFLKAIETNIGGAAKIIGEKSFTGALSNITASLSRIGANFLDAGGKGGGFFSQLKPLMVDMMDMMGGIEDKAASWGEKFGSAFATVVKIIRAVPGPILAIGTAFAVSAGPAMQLTSKVIKTADAIRTFRTEEKAMSTLAGIANGKLTVQQALLMKVGARLQRGARSVISYSKSLIAKASTTVKDTASTVANTAATKINGIASSTAAQKVLAFAAAHKIALMASLGLVAGIAALAIYMVKTGTNADQMADKITAFAENLAGMIIGFANKFPAMLERILPAITETVQTLVTAIPSLIPVIAKAGITLFMALVDSLVQIIPEIVKSLSQIVQAIVDAIPVLLPALIQAAITLFMAFVKAIPTIAITLISAMPLIIAAIVKGLLAGLGQIFSVGVTLLKRLWSGISSWAGSLKSKVLSLARSLPGKVKGGIGSLISIGKNWIEGLWNGIGAKKDWLCNKIRSLASNAKDAIKDFFGIHSPSTVMEDEVGVYIPEGLGIGIVKRTKNLVAQVRSQAAKVKSAYAEGLNGGTLTTIGSRFAAASVQYSGSKSEVTNVEQTFNFYQEAKSPIAIARELKKQALFGLAGDN